MELIDEIKSYSQLQQGWDEAESYPPTERSVQDALLFAEKLPGHVKKPTAMIAHDGTIGLYWDNGAHYADVEFNGDGTFSFFHKDRHANREKLEDGLQIDGEHSRFNWIESFIHHFLAY